MTKRTVIEDDVVLAYWEQIDYISMPYRRAFGREDAHMEGLLGLLIAIRSYRESYADFQAYMKQCAIHHLDSAKRAYQSKYRVEGRMSLDQHLADSTTTYKDLLPAILDAVEDSCLLCEFITGLPETLQTVFWRRYFGYSDCEIVAALSISGQEFSEKIANLQAAWYNYCDSIA